MKRALMTVAHAAEYLDVSPWEVRRLAKAGDIARVYIGQGTRSFRLTVESLDGYIANLPAEPVEV